MFQCGNEYSHERKVKILTRHFQLRKYGHGEVLLAEGHEPHKLMILKTGECQYTKQVFVRERSHIDTRTIKIANG
jgi:CRP-like cAMP-binding protein